MQTKQQCKNNCSAKQTAMQKTCNAKQTAFLVVVVLAGAATPPLNRSRSNLAAPDASLKLGQMCRAKKKLQFSAPKSAPKTGPKPPRNQFRKPLRNWSPRASHFPSRNIAPRGAKKPKKLQIFSSQIGAQNWSKMAPELDPQGLRIPPL